MALTPPKWIEAPTPGRLRTMAHPRGGPSLIRELELLAAQGVSLVVSLLEPDEAQVLGLDQEALACEEVGLDFLGYPIADFGLPDDDVRELVEALVGRLAQGQSIAIHCLAGIGRSTIVAALVLRRLGLSAAEAIARISTARGKRVPETPAQRAWIERFEL